MTLVRSGHGRGQVWPGPYVSPAQDPQAGHLGLAMWRFVRLTTSVMSEYVDLDLRAQQFVASDDDDDDDFYIALFSALEQTHCARM